MERKCIARFACQFSDYLNADYFKQIINKLVYFIFHFSTVTVHGYCAGRTQ